MRYLAAYFRHRWRERWRERESHAASASRPAGERRTGVGARTSGVSGLNQ
jgi:hypothetical protein